MDVALTLAERYYLHHFHQTPAGLVRDCIRRSVLFTEPGGGLSFGHLTYQEFLAGIWLASQNPTLFILAHITDPWWKKSIEFYAAKRKEIDQLLEKALELNHDRDMRAAFDSLSKIAWMSSKELMGKVMSSTSATKARIGPLKHQAAPKVL